MNINYLPNIKTHFIGVIAITGCYLAGTSVQGHNKCTSTSKACGNDCKETYYDPDIDKKFYGGCYGTPKTSGGSGSKDSTGTGGQCGEVAGGAWQSDCSDGFTYGEKCGGSAVTVGGCIPPSPPTEN